MLGEFNLNSVHMLPGMTLDMTEVLIVSFHMMTAFIGIALPVRHTNLALHQVIAMNMEIVNGRKRALDSETLHNQESHVSQPM